MTGLIQDPTDPTTVIIRSASESAFGLGQGATTLRNVHPADRCAGRHCVVHNPSQHHMIGWPLHWRGDKQIMERTCPHGIGHGDPDDLDYQESVGRGYVGVHTCDGCCSTPPSTACEDQSHDR